MPRFALGLHRRTPRRISLQAPRLVFCLLPALIPAFSQSNGVTVQDIFGRNLNTAGLTLVDWDGYMANPAIKFFVIPPSNAKFPATAALTANDQRLYFDLPSTVGASGPSKTISFPDSSPVAVYLGNAPDRDTIDGYYQLAILFTGADGQSTSLTIPVHKIDQDRPSTVPYAINTDFTQDKTGFFATPANRAAIQQELADWAYFVDNMNLDAVPGGAERTFIWNSDGFVSGSYVVNSSAYTGYLLYVYGIHSSALRSGGEVSSAGGFQTSSGVPLQLKRSGGLEIETEGNYNTLGWLTSTSDLGWWVSANLGNQQNELFSISHHESGHATAFNAGQPNWAAFKANGCVNDAAVIAYHGSCPKIDSSDHLSGEIDNDSLMGAFGNEYHGLAPARRWFITKLDLLVLHAVGYKLRKTSAFIPLSLTTSTLSSGSVQQPYSQMLSAQGGIPFYNWTIASGTLPDGLTLDSFSGMISGVPTKPGTFTFTARVQEYVASSAGVTAPYTLTIAAGGGGTAPAITEVDNAFSNSAAAGIQSGNWVAIRGTNLSNTNPGRGWNGNENFPTSMDGTSVTINGKTAFMYFISPTQVNVQAPTDAALGPVNVVVNNNGALSAAATATYQTNSPALLQWGGGQYPYALITDGATYIGKASVITGTVSAHAGENLTLWVTGLGATNPDFPAGQQPGVPLPTLVTNPTVTVGGVNVPVQAAVLRYAGLYQVNVQLPASVPVGDQPIRITQGSFQSPAGILINIQ